MPKLTSHDDLIQLCDSLGEQRSRCSRTISICGGTGCRASGTPKIVEALKTSLANANLAEAVTLRVTGCHGFCEQGPMLVIEPGNIFYRNVTADDVEEVVSQTLVREEIVERLLYVDPVSQRKITTEAEIPFYRAQDRILLARNKLADPTSISDYLSLDGYRAFGKALFEMMPDEVIAEISASKLRGRGGAGFPTGTKWSLVRRAPGDIKYVVCNADEGDPGAYMDRSLLEGNPHAVIEGMLIGAYAIGAQSGYIYVRDEYALAVSNAQCAIEQAHEHGLLGEGILGTGFSFDLKIARGAGAFVCGEESALIASLEGRRGMPRPRPPFPAESGLWGKPTNINNVETFSNVAPILMHGAEWFAAKGTERSKGTKIFALTGRIQNTGLVEVAMGTPLRTLIFDIGGGSPSGTVKAAQTGGPSGGCLPASKFDLPVDFDALTAAGSMVGSGGLVVMDDQTCMVDVARYFLEFTQSESCGKCPPCRIGTRHMLDLLRRICAGKGTREDAEQLQELAEEVKTASLCGLGRTAPNPVLTTLRYFRDEYDAHINDKYCPAHVCRGLFRYTILEETCTGCGACRRKCPVEAIAGERKKPHRILQERCIYCGACFEVCPVSAVVKVRPDGGSNE